MYKQFAVRSSQFAVRSSQFAVRSSQFAVRSSQFAVRLVRQEESVRSSHSRKMVIYSIICLFVFYLFVSPLSSHRLSSFRTLSHISTTTLLLSHNNITPYNNRMATTHLCFHKNKTEDHLGCALLTPCRKESPKFF
jgi:hypothetical protein